MPACRVRYRHSSIEYTLSLKASTCFNLLFCCVSGSLCGSSLIWLSVKFSFVNIFEFDNGVAGVNFKGDVFDSVSVVGCGLASELDEGELEFTVVEKDLASAILVGVIIFDAAIFVLLAYRNFVDLVTCGGINLQ